MPGLGARPSRRSLCVVGPCWLTASIMDERALTELLECSVCLEQLDATSKVLQCQHTFCRRCLEEIVATKHELRCPECRALVEIRVDELPSNILLIRLLEGLKNCKAGLSGHTSVNSSPVHTAPPSPANAAGGIRTSPVHKVGALRLYKSVTVSGLARVPRSGNPRTPTNLSL